jgi:thiol-disulfide isomerase/thioredoxin
VVTEQTKSFKTQHRGPVSANTSHSARVFSTGNYSPADYNSHFIIANLKTWNLFAAFFLIAGIAFGEDFRTINGREYKNVRLSRVEPDGIVLVTSSGISKIYFTELPKRVQERFHYDATKAAAYSSSQAANQEAFRRQQAELERKLAEKNSKYWIDQQSAKNQQGKLPAPDVLVADRGQQVEVITHGAPVDITKHLALGNVTVVDFYADWCGPCREVSPSLEQMAKSDPQIALRKIDIVNWNTAVVRQYNIHSIPQVNIYNRVGHLIGTVVGADIEGVKRYVAQAKTGG